MAGELTKRAERSDEVAASRQSIADALASSLQAINRTAEARRLTASCRHFRLPVAHVSVVWQTPEKITLGAVTIEYARAPTAYYGGGEVHILRRNSLVDLAAFREHRMVRSILLRDAPFSNLGRRC